MRIWKDRIVQYVRRFTQQNNADGTITLIPAPGTVTQEGTPVNAAMLNAMEADIVKALTEDAYAEDTGSLNNYSVTVPGLSAYIPGQRLRFKAKSSNTGVCTLNINNLGVKAIKVAGLNPAPITANYKNKVSGSLTENPHRLLVQWSSLLRSPSDFSAEPNTSQYGQIVTLDGIIYTSTTSTNGNIAQQLLAFNLIRAYEDIYGAIPAVDKNAWIKSNILKVTYNWYGYGSGPSGNKATVAVWNGSWMGSISNTANSPSLISSYFWDTNTPITNMVDGFIYLLAYSDASNGSIASVINTDYVSLAIEFKNLLPDIDPDTIKAGQIVEVTYDGTNFQADLPKEYYGEDVGSPNNYAVNIPQLTSYKAGQKVRFRAQSSNTQSCTLSINGLGAKPLKANMFLPTRLVNNFVNKVASSGVENPHWYRFHVGNTLRSAMASVTENYMTGWQSGTETHYNGIRVKNDGVNSLIRASAASGSGLISQQIFSFDVIQAYERKYGVIPVSKVGTALEIKARQIAWLSKNIDILRCKWTGYGTGPNGNRAHLTIFSVTSNAWSSTTVNHSSGSFIELTRSTPAISDVIDSNGFVHFLAYSDPSSSTVDGVTYTDYVEFEIDTKEASNLEPYSIVPGQMVEALFDGVNFQMVSAKNQALNNKALSIYRASKDNEGIYTEIFFRRLDNTLYKKHILWGGTSPKYSNQSIEYYALDGVTMISKTTYALSYDSDDEIQNEVVIT